MSVRPQPAEQLNVFEVSFSHQDIERVVEDFYTQVSVDELLKVPFGSVEDWPEHIEKLTHFWWLRFGGKPYLPYRYNPPQKHFERGFTRPLLKRWLALFKATMEKHLLPEQVELWSDMAERMGQSLAHRNELMLLAHKE